MYLLSEDSRPTVEILTQSLPNASHIIYRCANFSVCESNVGTVSGGSPRRVPEAVFYLQHSQKYYDVGSIHTHTHASVIKECNVLRILF